MKALSFLLSWALLAASGLTRSRRAIFPEAPSLIFPTR